MMDPVLRQAIRVARDAHAGQLDKGGNPYIRHPLAVMRLVGDDLILRQIAVLHDVVEDTDVTLADLRDRGFSDRVMAGVDAMSRRDGEPNRVYFARVMANSDAILVKMADLTHNMDLSRIPEVTPEWESKRKWMRDLRKSLVLTRETGVPHLPDKKKRIRPRPDLVDVARNAGSLP